MASISTKVYTGVRQIPQPDDTDVDRVPVDIDFPTTAPVANDIWKLAKIPAGVSWVDYDALFPDIDSGGSPTFAFSIGELNAAETDLAVVYASGLTAGQSNAIVRAPNSDQLWVGGSAAERRIGIKITTAAATWNGANKTGTVLLALRG